MKNLWVKINERTWVTEPPETGDGDWLDQGSTATDYALQSVHASEQSYAWHTQGPDDLDVGQECYVLFVKYGTGDTFSRGDAGEVVGVYSTYAEAQEQKRIAELSEAEWREETDGKGYRAWDGYFEHFQSATIQVFLLQP